MSWLQGTIIKPLVRPDNEIQRNRLARKKRRQRKKKAIIQARRSHKPVGRALNNFKLMERRRNP